MENAPNKPVDMLKVAETIEQCIDEQLSQLDIVCDDIDKLRETRLKQLKKQEQDKREWLALGHGEYEELAEEGDFFEIAKKSKNILCHFYKDESPRCKIVDHHFKILTKQHLEAKFCKINVLRCPFLTERLRIKVIPTIAAVIDGKTKDFIIGFTDLGNCDDFSTEMLEWRIAQSGVLQYNGDLQVPPDKQKKEKESFARRTTIRENSDDSDSDDGL